MKLSGTMRRVAAGVDAMLAASALILFCGTIAATDAVARPAAGDPAPPFVGVDREGKSVSVADFTGKIVVLSFWASWCGPCRKELPILEGIAVTSKQRVQVVAVNIEDASVYRDIASKASSLAMLVVSDADGRAQKAYGVSGIPHMVIIGRDGHVLQVHRGYSDAGVDEAIDDLNGALAK